MNSGTVQLIATDPPFNKGRDFHATPDSLATGARFQDRWSWDDDVHPEWVDQLEDDWPDVLHVIEGSRKSYGDDMGAFLCFMGVRLLEMRRVLSDDGSIYLHCDPTASHYLKELMDAIFGRKNFRNEIVWCYKSRPQPKGNFGQKHDVILFYRKGRNHKFHWAEVARPLSPVTVSKYRHKDADGRLYRLQGRGITGSPIRSAKDVDPKWEEERPDLVVRDYLDTKKGASREDWWVDIDILNQSANERTDYPTQKPLVLYERIIRASSSPGDLVLDPFAGCATTCVAAERLGRKWVGIDIWDKAHETVIQRLEQEGLAAPDSSESERLLTFGDITYSREPPVRTDAGEEAVPFLKLRTQRPTEPWASLSRTVMTNVLVEAQRTEDGVVCAGCGRTLEREFMQLDHKMPRKDGGENHILNRILLCGPCNRKKGANLTLSGLVRANRADGWMTNKVAAESSQTHAQAEAERIRSLSPTEIRELRRKFE